MDKKFKTLNDDHTKKLMSERRKLLLELDALTNRIKGLDRALEILGIAPDITPDINDQVDFSSNEVSGSPVSLDYDIAKRNKRQSKVSIIRRVLTSAGDGGLSVKEVVDACRDLGVDLQPTSAASVLSRMKQKGEIRYGNGRYFGKS